VPVAQWIRVLGFEPSFYVTIVRMAYKNIDDRKVASKKHYLKNKQRYLDRNKRYREEIRKYVQDIKENTPCADCGKKYPYYVMDFDHLGDKEFDINYLTATGRCGKLRDEIKKCEVVCANCHRIRTHNRASTSSSVD
jgi:hypothetical protein